ncbi:MAG: DUF763 domain-containing protein, partial [Deltaproteobacteria bacterium]
SDPFWFQAFGCLLGMDWHSSGITTSVMGALKRGLRDRQRQLGLYVCGGRGRHSLRTPRELYEVAERTGLDGDDLVRTSRLIARVDNNAVQDGYTVYLHSFVVTSEGDWTVIQQGMNPSARMARRYHWHSARVHSFVEEPHSAVVGENRGIILNLTDNRAADCRNAVLERVLDKPGNTLRELVRIRKLRLPSRHHVMPSDVVLSRLAAVLQAARTRPPAEFSDVLLLPGLGPRSLEALVLAAEVIHGAPARFSDPARFAFAHGGKDGHPHPVHTKVYDRTIEQLESALGRARTGSREKLEAIRRLERLQRRLESSIGKPSSELVAIAQTRGRRDSPLLGGRTVNGSDRKLDGQLSLAFDMVGPANKP